MFQKTVNYFFLKILPVFIFLLLAILIIFLTSCNIDKIVIAAAENSNNMENTPGIHASSIKSTTQGNQNFLIDNTKIKLDTIESIDLKISNCNLSQDIYEDIIILGEVKNISLTNKTNLEITFDFYDKEGNKISSGSTPAFSNYLDIGKTLPFLYYFEEKDKYPDISTVKIGINYKNYNENFLGNPEVFEENFHYDRNFLIVDGKVINKGQNKIENLKLLGTFYNKRNQVVFIKECSAEKDILESLEQENFEIKILLDDFSSQFNHFAITPFFKDSLKIKESV
ncbi:MAG: FxLYD domain-containing protein [Actinobacteria bacterium]|nr:FxLYD domain-containing protein [Actinomycetota bacterium]